MALTLKNAAAAIKVSIAANVVPFIKGAPGVGKSDAIKSIARENDWKVIDLRLAQCDPTDLSGLPFFQNGRATYLPMDTFPVEGQAKVFKDPAAQKLALSLMGESEEEIIAAVEQAQLPTDQYKGWLLFLDELPNAPIAVQHAAYKLVLDRQVGTHNLHEEVYIVAAGNREEDNCFVQPMPEALKTRMVHLDLVLSADEWLEWAYSADVDSRVTAYINFDKSKLQNRHADSAEASYACPRTWAFASSIVKQFPNITGLDATHRNVLRNVLNGTIGTGVTAEFLAFTEHFDKLPSIEEIIKNPSKVPVPDEVAVIYATTGMLAANTTMENVDKLVEYLDRFKTEFKIVGMRDMVHRARGKDIKLVDNPAVRSWMIEMSRYLHA